MAVLGFPRNHPKSLCSPDSLATTAVELEEDIPPRGRHNWNVLRVPGLPLGRMNLQRDHRMTLAFVGNYEGLILDSQHSRTTPTTADSRLPVQRIQRKPRGETRQDAVHSRTMDSCLLDLPARSW